MDYENQQQAAQGGSQQQTTQQYYEQRFVQIMQRVCVLEQQVANHAKMGHDHVNGPLHTALKSQAAQQQAQPRFGCGSAGGLNESQIGLPAEQNLYAPPRSDTKPLLDMAAFVRKVASINPDHVAYSMYHAVRELVEEAQDILKRST